MPLMLNCISEMMTILMAVALVEVAVAVAVAVEALVLAPSNRQRVAVVGW